MTSPLGAHVKVGGGLVRGGLARVAEIGAEAVQVFVGNPRGWAQPTGDPAQDTLFRDVCGELGIPAYVHTPYLVNLGSPTPLTLERSVAAVAHSMRRGKAIGALGVVVHTGSAVDAAHRDAARRQVREAVQPLLDAHDGPDLLLEPTAGQGESLCATVEDLGPYLAALDHHPRIGVCLDTCHAFAAGHDLATPGGATATLDTLVRVAGEGRLRLVHADDSKDPLGSSRDRHEAIGEGAIGLGRSPSCSPTPRPAASRCSSRRRRSWPTTGPSSTAWPLCVRRPRPPVDHAVVAVPVQPQLHDRHARGVVGRVLTVETSTGGDDRPVRLGDVVVVMQPGASPEDVEGVVRRVESAGGEAFVSRGVTRTIIGLVGDIETFSGLNLRAMPGVADVMRVSAPYKLVSRVHHPQMSTVFVRGVPIGPDTFTLIAGPCAVETPQQTLEAAEMAKAAGATLLRGGAYKPRTSPYAFQGLGEAGLKILAEVREMTGLPVVTEVVDPHDVDLVSSYADMLQVGTRNMQNFGLLQAVGQSGKAVMLKSGMQATVEEWLMAAEYIAQRGNLDIVLCERGIRTFEKATRNTLDISAVPVVHDLAHLPVIVDPSHSGGRRDLVVPLSRAAIAVGADGIIVDVHPHPDQALCDGPQALVDNDLRALAAAVRQLPPLLGRRPATAPAPTPAP